MFDSESFSQESFAPISWLQSVVASADTTLELELETARLRRLAALQLAGSSLEQPGALWVAQGRRRVTQRVR